MDYPQHTFEAKYDAHNIITTDITMIRLGQWPSGEWSASGHHIVWHSSGKCNSIESALHQLIDNVATWVEENGTRKVITG